MASAVVRKQDLPPPGGYKPIPFKRIPAKQLFSGYTMFAGYIGVTAFAMYLYSKNYKQIVKDQIETRSAKMAIFPMLLAERDRAYLKQLRINREAERELMKDVPGWEGSNFLCRLEESDKFLKLGINIQICGPAERAHEVIIVDFSVGTYYGEKVYKLLPPDTLVEPIFHEYYAHSRPYEWYQRAYLKLRT